MYHCTSNITWNPIAYIPVVNSLNMIKRVQHVAAELSPVKQYVELDRPTFVAEDVAFFNSRLLLWLQVRLDILMCSCYWLRLLVRLPCKQILLLHNACCNVMFVASMYGILMLYKYLTSQGSSSNVLERKRFIICIYTQHLHLYSTLYD